MRNCFVGLCKHWPCMDSNLIHILPKRESKLEFGCLVASEPSMHLLLDIAHYIIGIASVRESMGDNAVTFSRQNPLSCWLSSVIICFAGGILANLLLCEPLISIFSNGSDLLLASVVWYLIFYSPSDICFKTIKLRAFLVVPFVLKEIQRSSKVLDGVLYAAKLYPHSLVVQIIIGVVKGAGAGIIRTFEQLVRGVWIPHENEILRPSLATKVSLVGATIFTLHLNYFKSIILEDYLLMIVSCGFVFLKLNATFFNNHNPFDRVENVFCSVFMPFHSFDTTDSRLTEKKPGSEADMEKDIRKEN